MSNSAPFVPIANIVEHEFFRRWPHQLERVYLPESGQATFRVASAFVATAFEGFQ
jgi:hypothetical protein